MKYSHFSFDVWQTLIKSNPQYKIERAKWFFQNYNRDNKTIEEVQSIIRDVDVMCNYTNEVVGGNIDALEMYAMVLYKLGIDVKEINTTTVQSIYDDLLPLFELYPPVVYDDNTLPKLKELKERGCTLSILSNTAFIRGESLQKFIDREFNGLFNVQFYSDKCKVSKPNPSFFHRMTTYVGWILRKEPNEIIHIGDNPKADVEGATKAGIASFLINSNNKTILDIP